MLRALPPPPPLKRVWQLMRVATLARVWSPTLINFELVQILTRIETIWWVFSLYARGNIQSILINSHATLVLVWPRGTRVEKTLMQTLASQFSSTHIVVWPALNSRPSTIFRARKTHARMLIALPGRYGRSFFHIYNLNNFPSFLQNQNTIPLQRDSEIT
jgi:hypothetical protein